jgi:hypothetical protein
VSWEKLLADNRVKTHKTSLAEMIELREVITRDIKDAQIRELSLDRQFACLYSAALQLAHMIIACAGYRVSPIAGHHKTSFEVLHLILGKSIEPHSIYFDICRRKRNIVEYDTSAVATATEVKELHRKILEFQTIVEQWIGKNHPELS